MADRRAQMTLADLKRRLGLVKQRVRREDVEAVADDDARLAADAAVVTEDLRRAVRAEIDAANLEIARRAAAGDPRAAQFVARNSTIEGATITNQGSMHVEDSHVRDVHVSNPPPTDPPRPEPSAWRSSHVLAAIIGAAGS